MAGVGAGVDPVAGLLVGAEDDLVAAVPLGLELTAEDAPDLGGLTGLHGLGRPIDAEDEVVDAAAVADDAVGLRAVDVGAQVEAVRVVAAELSGGRHDAEELRVERVGVPDGDVEPQRDVLREVLEAPCAVERCRGRGVLEDQGADGLELVAEAIQACLSASSCGVSP